MKLKKWIALLLTAALAAGVFSACAPTVVVLQEAPKETAAPEVPAAPETQQPAGEGAAPVKTGLSFITTTTSSAAASAESDGVAQSDISLVAVTVDDHGVIDSCIIDSVQAKIGFNAKGELTGDVNAPILSKNELGTDYGMGKYSPIGKEWNEQAAALAEYVVGLTLEEVQGIKITSEGKPEDADLASSVTIYMGGLLAGIEDAVNNAVHMGAQHELFASAAHLDDQVAGSIPNCLDLFSQTILASVRLVRHNDNISALGQSLFAHFEFLHGSEENAVCLCVCQQLL